MRCQIEKNKEILLDEIELLGEKKMSEAVAEKLSVYRGAYKSLCMLERKKKKEYAAAWMEHPAPAADLVSDHIHTGTAPLTKADAVAWVEEMENADGTRGGHWTMEETEKVRTQKNIGCDPVMFYAAMNMMYSDYCRAAEKAGASTVELYARMAEAFLQDKDAQPDKLERYYRYIAAHK